MATIGHMIANFMFLAFVLVLISFAPMGEEAKWLANFWPQTAEEAFFYSFLLYGGILLLIYLQNLLLSKLFTHNKDALKLYVNLELILFLIASLFLLGSQRLFDQSSYFSETMMILFYLSLYFGGLALFHKTFYSSFSTTAREIRLLIPFVLPFLLLIFISEVLEFFPSWNAYIHQEGFLPSFILVASFLIFIILVMVFLPYFIQKIWKCTPIEDVQLKNRLDELCERAHFKHAGLKTWNILNHTLTAAIVGIYSKFRYVIFTKRVLQEMPSESIEAILAHEIGHNKRHHLFLYPYIFLGLVVILSLFSQFFLEPIGMFFKMLYTENGNPIWNLLYPMAIFFLYALIVGFYIRIVFGYFSRLFERQADLYVFTLNVPPQHLVDALQRVAVNDDGIYAKPNWHHYSIKQRIDFLNVASSNSKYIAAHEKKVKKSLFIYSLLLFAGILLLLI